MTTQPATQSTSDDLYTHDGCDGYHTHDGCHTWITTRQSVLLHFITFIFLCTLTTQSATAQPFSQLVIFGDSLSDMGNAYNELGTWAMAHPEDYYDGRFSNGPVWVEYLANELQLPTPAANTINTSSGRDYAFGGAFTHASALNITHWVINDIDEQVDDYLNNDGGPVGDELFILWGGANNLFDNQTNFTSIVGDLVSDINSLYNAGARNFMVVNLPLLGQTPRYNNTSSEATFDARSTQFNNVLSSSLDSLETQLASATFFRIDAANLISSAISNPAAYGFTNVTTPAMDLTGIDPDTYLFWDQVHPTTAAHEMLAKQAAATLFDTLYTLPGDLNLDGFVGLDDIDIVLANWNTTVTPGNILQGDPTADGYVGLTDLDVILNNWNATPGSITPASVTPASSTNHPRTHHTHPAFPDSIGNPLPPNHHS